MLRSLVGSEMCIRDRGNTENLIDRGDHLGVLPGGQCRDPQLRVTQSQDNGGNFNGFGAGAVNHKDVGFFAHVSSLARLAALDCRGGKVENAVGVVFALGV